MSDLLGGVLGLVNGLVGTVGNVVGGVTNSLVGPSNSTNSSLLGGLTNTLNVAVGGLTNTLDTAVTGLTDTLNTTVTGVTGVLDNTVNGVTGIVDTTIGGVTGTIDNTGIIIPVTTTPTLSPSYSPTLQPTIQPTLSPITSYPTIKATVHLSADFAQVLSGVDCYQFYKTFDAITVFEKAVQATVLDATSQNYEAVMTSIDCPPPPSDRYLLQFDPYHNQYANENPFGNTATTTSNSLHRQLPAISFIINYSLSWSTDLSTREAIMQAFLNLQNKLTESVSTGEFNRQIQNIAQKFNVKILSSATSSYVTNTSAVKYSLDVGPNNGGNTISGLDFKTLVDLYTSSNVAIATTMMILSLLISAVICYWVYYYYTTYKDHLEYKKTNGEDVDDLEDLSDLYPFTARGSRSGKMKYYDAISVRETASMSIGTISRPSRFTRQYTSDGSFELIPHTNTSTVKYTSNLKIPCIEWTDIVLKSSTGRMQDAVIGKGSFGSVVRAVLISNDTNVEMNETISDSIDETLSSNKEKNSNKDMNNNNNTTNTTTTASTSEDVVVKIMTKSISSNNNAEGREKALKAAIEEVSTILDAESRIFYKDCITKIYGICEGPLPPILCKLMKVSTNAEAVGIVMRYEGGGTLDSWIHPKAGGQILSLTEKIRILMEIARGLAELHAAGVVHADIKPDNILLSTHTPPQVRLADFGLAIIRDDSLIMSTLAETGHFKGTPLYCAPEMLVNPYNDNVDDKIAKASRKTDMYAFAILAWEVLSSQKPFSEIRNQSLLGAKVHQGVRPGLDKLPADCPPKLLNLIEDCWDADRSIRKTAIECYSTLQYCYSKLIHITSYDIYLTCENQDRKLINYIYQRLIQLGFQVCFNSRSQLTEDDTSSSFDPKIEIQRSKLIFAVITPKFQENDYKMKELLYAKHINNKIIPIFLHPMYLSWVTQDIMFYCQLRSHHPIYYDFSSIAKYEEWYKEDGPTAALIQDLNDCMSDMIQYIRNLDL